MQAIKAQLIQPVSYIHYLGHTVTIPSGTPLEVLPIPADLESTSINGSHAEQAGDFFGVVAGDTFDIPRTAFKTFD